MFNEAASTKASTRTNFKMVEYVVVDAEIAAFTDFCLCEVYKNRRKSPGNSDSLTDGDDTHPSAEANISSPLRAHRCSGSFLPQHISTNASNLDGLRKRRLNSSLPPLPSPNHNHHVQHQQQPQQQWRLQQQPQEQWLQQQQTQRTMASAAAATATIASAATSAAEATAQAAAQIA